MQELKRLRKARGLSQAKLAALADLDPSTVSQIETGARQANTRTLERLAQALGAEVADLFPKGQAPLPDFKDARRASVFAEAMIDLADHWIARVSDPETNSQAVGGLIDAALDLGDVVDGERLPELWYTLPDEDQHMVLEVLKKTNEVAKRGLARLKDEENEAEFKRRRAKIRELTQQINLRSAETA